jgi:hypothetical protein
VPIDQNAKANTEAGPLGAAVVREVGHAGGASVLSWRVVSEVRLAQAMPAGSKGSKGKGAERNPAEVEYFRCTFEGGETDEHTLDTLQPLLDAAVAAQELTVQSERGQRSHLLAPQRSQSFEFDGRPAGTRGSGGTAARF